MTLNYFKLGIILVSLLVVGAGCYKTKSTTNNTNTNSTVNSSTTTNSSTTGSFDTSSAVSKSTSVTITSAGLSPASLTVAAGTTVTFTNNDSTAHQIASNPHPAHTGLPGFDQVVRAGQTYSFTFNQTGTFGYHDHLDAFNSKWQGTVVVQ